MIVVVVATIREETLKRSENGIPFLDPIYATVFENGRTRSRYFSFET